MTQTTSTDSEPSTETSVFVFADLAGYTALTEAHGDEHAADEAAAFCDAVRGLLGRYQAEEVKAIGDALLLRVAEPAQALHLAARIVGDLGGRDRSLGVRIGMHTGTALRRGDDWFGSAVNVASRVADLACAGEVLMTSATRDAVARALLPGQLRSRGEHELKNLRDPVTVFELIPEGEDHEDALPVDPVCRMVIDPASAADDISHHEVTYYFCSGECAEAFRERPERYAAR
jgi:adenylate cyclase